MEFFSNGIFYYFKLFSFMKVKDNINEKSDTIEISRPKGIQTEIDISNIQVWGTGLIKGVSVYKNWAKDTKPTGNDNGITKVKSIIELKQNGGLENRFKYLMNNIWVDGHQILYKEDPTASVLFN